MMTTTDPARFRAYNDSTCDALMRFTDGAADEDPASFQFMCECSLDGCQESIGMTIAQYQAVRSGPAHRVIAAHHLASSDPLATVEQYDGYWIVHG